MTITPRIQALKLRVALAAGLAVGLASAAGAPSTLPTTQPAACYANPIDFSYPFQDRLTQRNIKELRDPAIIREGNTYYLTYTAYPFSHSTARDATWPDMHSSPGIMLYTSTDLKTWNFHRWLVKSADLPENSPYKHRFWAPEIHKLNGRFYLIFTADNWLKDEYNKGGEIGSYVAFVGVSDRVDGPYEHITWLKGAGCDTTLFGDDDGRTYAIMPYGNQYLQEVDLRDIDRGEIQLLGKRQMIMSKENADVGKKTNPDYLEGPWMIKRHGRYILLSAGLYKAGLKGEARDLAPGYWLGTATAENITGPYRKDPQLIQAGHVAVFTGPDGRDWLSYRGEESNKAHGRLCIDPIPFAPDGSLAPFSPSLGTVKMP